MAGVQVFRRVRLNAGRDVLPGYYEVPRQLSELEAGLVTQYPDWAVRVDGGEPKPAKAEPEPASEAQSAIHLQASNRTIRKTLASMDEDERAAAWDRHTLDELNAFLLDRFGVAVSGREHGTAARMIETRVGA